MKPRLVFSNRYIFLGDLFLIIASVLGSFVLRLNLGPLLVDHFTRAMVMLGLALIIKPIIYYAFGLYRRLWIYASIQEMKLIAIAVTLASILISIIITILQAFQVFPGFSRSVLFIDWLLSLIAVGGLRFAARIALENQSNPSSLNQKTRRVLIVGAGDAGVLALRELQKSSRISPDGTNLVPVCFVDDDPVKIKQEIHGVPVVGELAALPQVIKKYKIDEVVIAMPSAPGQVIRNVTNLCLSQGVPFRTIPSLPELIGGKVSVNRLREVEISDLLRREPIHIDDQLIGQTLKDRRILITGAGGSIGSELCRQIARWEPAEMILIGHGENSIFEILLELNESYPQTPVYAVIGDIRNIDRMRQVFERHQPQVLFHAAAHKHVTLMEMNIEEAVTNNILGTQVLVELAIETPVERMVMISSDKAVYPSSIMGATKRVAELIVMDAARKSGKSFSVVRFGNVLGSRGSIVPLFKRQIASGGPITITHPDMKRYFMTIPEAVHLVLQASAMGAGTETFVLRMGEQVRIVELAEDLIRLSGLEPGKDVEIIFTGAKPGEKLSEQLWETDAIVRETTHPDIIQVEEDNLCEPNELTQAVDTLIADAQQGKAYEIEVLLRKMIPGAVIRPPDATDVGSLV